MLVKILLSFADLRELTMTPSSSDQACSRVIISLPNWDYFLRAFQWGKAAAMMARINAIFLNHQNLSY